MKEILTNTELIQLSRELVEQLLNVSKSKNVKKEHYCMLAISNFISIKEKIMKKNNSDNTIYFDVEQNEKLIPMILSFYNKVNSVSIGNKKCILRRPAIHEIRKKIRLIGVSSLAFDENELLNALYIFNEFRNKLSHYGNYQIDANRNLIKFDNTDIKIDMPVSLLDYVAFYVKVNYEKPYLSDFDILELYEKYQKSGDYKKYYHLKSDEEDDEIYDLAFETMQKKIRLTLQNNFVKGGSSQDPSFDDEETQLINKIYEYQQFLKRSPTTKDTIELKKMISKLRKSLAKERVNWKRVNICIKNIANILGTDRYGSILYSHSIILFSNIKSPIAKSEDELKQRITGLLKRLFNQNVSDKQKIIDFFNDLYSLTPSINNIEQTSYRNSVFHNNLESILNETGREVLHFWDREDNITPGAPLKFEVCIDYNHYFEKLVKYEETDNSNFTIGDLRIFLRLYFGKDKSNEILKKIKEIVKSLLSRDLEDKESIIDILNEIKEIKNY